MCHDQLDKQGGCGDCACSSCTEAVVHIQRLCMLQCMKALVHTLNSKLRWGRRISNTHLWPSCQVMVGASHNDHFPSSCGHRRWKCTHMQRTHAYFHQAVRGGVGVFTLWRAVCAAVVCGVLMQRVHDASTVLTSREPATFSCSPITVLYSALQVCVCVCVCVCAHARARTRVRTHTCVFLYEWESGAMHPAQHLPGTTKRNLTPSRVDMDWVLGVQARLGTLGSACTQ